VNTDEICERESERTRIQNAVVGEDFEYVRHCAGTHIHVEQQPGRAIDQLNAFIALDPALALVNSSPYFQGRHLAAGARSKLYRWMAYDDVPHQGRLWAYADDADEWTRRLERRYEEFLTAATDAGVDRRAIASSFDPECRLDAGPAREEFGTVEWRSPDAALPSQVVRLADDLAGVVERMGDAEVRIEGDSGRVGEDALVLPEFDAVIEYVNAAIRGRAGGAQTPGVPRPDGVRPRRLRAGVSGNRRRADRLAGGGPANPARTGRATRTRRATGRTDQERLRRKSRNCAEKRTTLLQPVHHLVRDAGVARRRQGV